MTAGGVFSPEHLDRGTEVLLHTVEQLSASSPEPVSSNDSQKRDSYGPLLDIGCGWGPIALSAALRHPDREVWAIDVNERSRHLTRTNAELLNLTNVRVAAPDEVPASIEFSDIHSNPPIRVGKQALHDLLRLWLPRLEPNGVAYLVVAKHLGAQSLQKWLATEFDDFEVDRVARDKGFHVIEAVRRA